MRVATVSGRAVLAASMDNDFSLLPHGSFPAYTSSKKTPRLPDVRCPDGHRSSRPGGLEPGKASISTR